VSDHDQVRDPDHVEREMLLPASPDEVWESLTDDDRLSEWLAEEVELDPVEGGDLRIREEDGVVREGTVETVVEPERLTFTWSRPDEEPSHVDFRMEPAEGGTRLVVRETRVAGPVGRVGGIAAWTRRLARLERALLLLPVA
jgi:uncharacterized protein YndB with AHSA1/START domain